MFEAGVYPLNARASMSGVDARYRIGTLVAMLAVPPPLFAHILYRIDRLRSQAHADMTNGLPLMRTDDGTGVSGARPEQPFPAPPRPIGSSSFDVGKQAMKLCAFVVLLLIGQTLGGCSVNRPITQPVPSLKNEIRSGTIAIARRSAFLIGFVSVYVSIDGVPVAELGSGQHTRFRVDAGKHELGLYSFDISKQDPYRPGFLIWVPCSENRSQRFISCPLSVDVEPGGEVYFVIEPFVTGFTFLGTRQYGWRFAQVRKWPDYIELSPSSMVKPGLD